MPVPVETDDGEALRRAAKRIVRSIEIVVDANRVFFAVNYLGCGSLGSAVSGPNSLVPNRKKTRLS